MARFEVRERSKTGQGSPEYLVVNTEDKDRPVAEFDNREDAQAHADRLEQGPFDWDEQEQWQDEDDEDDWDN